MAEHVLVCDLDTEEMVLMVLSHSDKSLLKEFEKFLNETKMGDYTHFKDVETAKKYIKGYMLLRGNPLLTDDEITRIEKEYGV